MFVLGAKIIIDRPIATYSQEELKKMPDKELYQLFIKNGLQVDDELRDCLTESEIATMLKDDFDLLIHGDSSRSASMYLRFAKEVNRVFDLISNK